jgi:zinc protease
LPAAAARADFQGHSRSPLSHASLEPCRCAHQFLVALVLAGSALARTAGAQAADAPLPFDSTVLRGRLPNGLRYLVRRNTLPEKRAELRLVVDAGSILEDDSQLGVAHFVEHMAFNGTRRFPKADLVNFLERSGVRFGRT